MQLEDYISAGRLNIYTDVLKLKPGEELGGYNWNKAVSAAMQPLMHCLEVTLRNAIDGARTAKNHPPDQPYPDHCHYWSRFYPYPLTFPLPCGRGFFTKH
ncbi:hypothetical protein BI322_02990 [Klebsiella oxytoca]|nr:hypothetical protein BI322_02990 [Klebsiella oxytoca]